MALLLGDASTIQVSEFKNGPDASLAEAAANKKWVELPTCATAKGDAASVPLEADLSNVTIATCKGPPPAKKEEGKEEKKEEEKKEGPPTPPQKPIFDPIQTAKDHKFKDSDHHVTLNPHGSVDPTDGMEGPLTPKHYVAPEPDVKGPVAAPGAAFAQSK